MSFDILELHPTLLRAVSALGFTAPTPVQASAIPPAREGRDVLACAATGTGKTAAFMLPILHRLLAGRRRATRALVLAPDARAGRSDRRAPPGARPVYRPRRHGHLRWRRHGASADGAAAGRGDPGGDPGRLLDHLRHPYARLDTVEIVVLDEADRMLDMGFLPDVRRILGALGPARRQTMLFSATLPPAIVTLARDFLRDPARIDVERAPAPAAGVRHTAYPVAREGKSRSCWTCCAGPRSTTCWRSRAPSTAPIASPPR